MFDAKKKIKTTNNKKNCQKIFLLGASVATLVATGDPAPAGNGNNNGGQGSTPLGATGFTLGDAIGNATAAIDHIQTGVDGGYVDAGAGADFLEGGSGVDYFRGAAGIDKILGGDGLDNLVLIGKNLSQNLNLADITNANGTGVDLSKLLNLPDIIGQTVSDIGLDEIIDGGALGALLFAYGDLDLTQLKTLANITSIQALGGDIKISAKQLKELIDGGEFEALIGDGSVKLTITNDGVEIDVDFGKINLANIVGLDIADGITLSLDQADLLGILSILGAGKIKGASGVLDLNGIEVAEGINVVTEAAPQVIAAGAYDKVGGEFLVNLSENPNQVATVHPGDQTTPQAVGLSNGNYAISYNSNQNDIENEIAGRSILVKLYDELGAQLNYSGVNKTGIIPSAITDLNDGNYVLSFTENAPQIIGPFANDVRVLNFSDEGFSHGNTEGGKSVSPPTKVSTAIRNIEASHADLTGLLDGGYAVAWHSQETEGADTSNAGIKMRTYDKDGIQTTTPFTLNSVVLEQQSHVNIDTLKFGNVVAVWQADDGTPKAGQGLDSIIYDIKGQIWNPVTKSLEGTEFLINTQTTGSQFMPEVATLDSGDFIVGWQSGNEIKAQLYDGVGVKIGTEFKVNSNDGDNVGEFSVASIGSGFVFVWQSDDHNSADTDGLAIKGQVYNNAAVKTGNEFLVNNVYNGDQSMPSVVGLRSGDDKKLEDGGFAVVWQSDDKISDDKDGTAIKAQIFRPFDYVAPEKIVVAATKIQISHSEIFTQDNLPFDLAEVEATAFENIDQSGLIDWGGDNYDFG